MGLLKNKSNQDLHNKNSSQDVRVIDRDARIVPHNNEAATVSLSKGPQTFFTQIGNGGSQDVRVTDGKFIKKPVPHSSPNSPFYEIDFPSLSRGSSR